MGCAHSKEVAPYTPTETTSKSVFDGNKAFTRKGTIRSLTNAFPDALWLQRIKSLDETLAHENRPLDHRDSASVVSIYQALADEAASLHFDIDTRFSQLYAKQWWWKSKHLEMCAHKYHAVLPPSLFMPHSHKKNFYSLCVRGGYRHVLYESKPLEGDLTPWYSTTRPENLVAGKPVVSQGKPAGTRTGWGHVEYS